MRNDNRDTDIILRQLHFPNNKVCRGTMVRKWESETANEGMQPWEIMGVLALHLSNSAE